MGMSFQVGRLRFKERKKAIGTWAFYIVLLPTELILVLAVFVTIFMQFRRKLVQILHNLFDLGSIYDDLMSPICGLDVECGYSIAQRIGLAMITSFFIALLAFSIWKSPIFRRCLLEVFVPLTFISGLAAISAGYLWKATGELHLLSIIVGVLLLVVAVFISIFEFDLSRTAAPEPKIFLPPPSSQQRTAPSPMLPILWGMYLLLVIGVWTSPIFEFSPAPPLPPLYTKEDSIQKRALEIVTAIDENQDIVAIGKIKGDESGEILLHPVWGKLVLYRALDKSPVALESILTRPIVLPLEFIDHALPKLEADKNCRAIERLIRYSRERQLTKRSIASSPCPPKN